MATPAGAERTGKISLPHELSPVVVKTRGRRFSNIKQPNPPFHFTDKVYIKASSQRCVTAVSSVIFYPCPTDPQCPFCGDADFPNEYDAPDWSFLDAGYCISLQSRDDRATSMEKELHRVGLCRHTIFYRPIKHPRSTKIGVWESHRRVAKHALAQRHQNVLILEDDVVFSRSLTGGTTTAIKRSLQRLPTDWMAFFLGHWVLWMMPIGGRTMRSGSLCAHAYIASPRLLRWLRDHPFNKNMKRVKIAGKGIDAVYGALPKMYSLFPMIAIQSSSPSDHMKAKAKRAKLNDYISNSRYRDKMLSGLMRPNEIAVFLLMPFILAGRGIAEFTHHISGYRRGSDGGE